MMEETSSAIHTVHDRLSENHACGKGTTLQSLLDLICSQGAS
jgi:hypothetical protein